MSRGVDVNLAWCPGWRAIAPRSDQQVDRNGATQYIRRLCQPFPRVHGQVAEVFCEYGAAGVATVGVAAGCEVTVVAAIFKSDSTVDISIPRFAAICDGIWPC